MQSFRPVPTSFPHSVKENLTISLWACERQYGHTSCGRNAFHYLTCVSSIVCNKDWHGMINYLQNSKSSFRQLVLNKDCYKFTSVTSVVKQAIKMMNEGSFNIKLWYQMWLSISLTYKLSWYLKICNQLISSIFQCLLNVAEDMSSYISIYLSPDLV